MSAFDNAAFNTVHDFDGGAKRLAEMLGMSHGVLLHKVKQSDQANQLTVRQAIKIMMVTGDDRMLHGMANDMGAVLLVTRLDEICSSQFHQAFADSVGKFGKYLDTVSSALADGEVTANEQQLIDGTLGSMIQKATLLRAVARSMHKQRKVQE